MSPRRHALSERHSLKGSLEAERVNSLFPMFGASELLGSVLANELAVVGRLADESTT